MPETSSSCAPILQPRLPPVYPHTHAGWREILSCPNKSSVWPVFCEHLNATNGSQSGLTGQLQSALHSKEVHCFACLLAVSVCRQSRNAMAESERNGAWLPQKRHCKFQSVSDQPHRDPLVTMKKAGGELNREILQLKQRRGPSNGIQGYHMESGPHLSDCYSSSSLAPHSPTRTSIVENQKSRRSIFFMRRKDYNTPIK